MNDRPEMIFVNGLVWKTVSEKAPPSVIAKISVKKDEFIEWLRNADDSSTGWINIQCNLSKAGKFYFIQDTWVPGGPRKESPKAAPVEDDDDFPTM